MALALALVEGRGRKDRRRARKARGMRARSLKQNSVLQTGSMRELNIEKKNLIHDNLIKPIEPFASTQMVNPAHPKSKIYSLYKEGKDEINSSKPRNDFKR